MPTDRDLTTGPITRAVLSVSAPMSVGIFAVLSVGLADAYFLGRLGEAQLAAVGFLYPVTTAVTSLAIGLSAGATAALSQAIGRGDDRRSVARMALHALAFAVVLGIVAGGVIWLATGPLFAALGAGREVATEIRAYMGWWCVSFPALAAMMTVNAVFRAHGNAASAAIIMTSVAAVNVALDPVLIYGFGPIARLGTGGAAIATGIARVLSLAAGLIWAARRNYLSWDTAPFRGIGRSLRRIVEVGLPAAVSNAINPAGMAIVTGAVATLGETAVAGFGAATRVQTLALVPVLALSSGIGPVVGQNWGAAQVGRAQRAVRFTFLLCLVYGLALGVLLAVFAEPLSAIFASAIGDATFATTYLRWVGWTLFGYGVLVTGNAAMNARSRAVWSMGMSLSRIFVLYVPLAWIGVSVAGFAGIAAAAATANVAAAVAMVFAARANRLWPGALGLAERPKGTIEDAPGQLSHTGPTAG
ncbi:putative efflux protein, MATE family [Tranquillimonas rosea]|uniref:Putative efflux protein, MATE family n=1 Tax=Tranquillimonas rosea TaxID=641238 RepID=A0A1H9Q6Z7_9RHOB|nr:MATE family efflux transporter [Tranquillimonas rosea]SER55623.1 putative efflux protein, MATE family [Tranquillimonas rosea]